MTTRRSEHFALTTERVISLSNAGQLGQLSALEVQWIVFGLGVAWRVALEREELEHREYSEKAAT